MTDKTMWTELKSEEQIGAIVEESKSHPVLIFKHSTRCGISQTVLNRFERNWKTDGSTQVKPYFLDLLSHRNISNYIAEYFGVEHESPQILLVDHGKPVLVRSHMSIDPREVLEKATS
jgi:bacillithiol system protein YtxJ